MNSSEKLIKSVFALCFLFLFLFLIKFFNISYPISVTTTTKSTELSVVGEGKVEVIPDTAYVDVGITVDKAPSVNDAQKIISDKNNSIIKALKDLGIKEEDIKTSNFSIYPSYDERGRISESLGFNGNVTLTIRVPDVSLTAKVLEESTKAGANQIQATRFIVDKPETYRSEARDKAIANAKEQAEKIASTLGIKLGKIVNVVESSPDGQQYYPLMKTDSAAAMGGGSPNIEPGSQTITSVVTLFIEKK